VVIFLELMEFYRKNVCARVMLGNGYEGIEFQKGIAEMMENGY